MSPLCRGDSRSRRTCPVCCGNEWLRHTQAMTDTVGEWGYLGSEDPASLLSTHRVFKAVTSGRGSPRRQGLEDAL